MSHSPRIRTVLSCTLLVAALGAGATACGSSDGHPLSAKPYDAAGQIAFNGPAGTPEGGSGQAPGGHRPGRRRAHHRRDGHRRPRAATWRANSSADGARWHTTAPLAAGAHYTVKVSTEDEDGAPGRKLLTFDTTDPGQEERLKVEFGPEAGKYGVGQPVTAKLSSPSRTRRPGPSSSAR